MIWLAHTTVIYAMLSATLTGVYSVFNIAVPRGIAIALGAGSILAGVILLFVLAAAIDRRSTR